MEESISNEMIPLKSLLSQLIKQLKERGFAESTIHCIEVEAGHLQDYLTASSFPGYNPDAGQAFLSLFKNGGVYSDKSYGNFLALIRRLDDLYYGIEFVWRHSSKQSELPKWCQPLLEKHLENCKQNGNCEKSIIRKEIACRQFFVRLNDLGCYDIKDLNSELVQIATLSETAESAYPFVREMLCFLAAAGMLTADYSTLVPRIHRHINLPSTYDKDELQAVLAAVNTLTSIGKRDYAILLLASRLGIRAGDIANLTFDAIDFKQDRLYFVQEKTKNPIELTLLPEIKQALKDYIENGRPKSSSDHIFLSVKNPYRVIDRTLVHAITTQYMRKAGVDYAGKKHGPHSLRASLATAMVNNGMPYDATRKILGHESPESIKHYAALDVENLRKCAIKVPPANGKFAVYLSQEGRA